jgi:hypothetical protein
LFTNDKKAIINLKEKTGYTIMALEGLGSQAFEELQKIFEPEAQTIKHVSTTDIEPAKDSVKKSGKKIEKQWQKMKMDDAEKIHKFLIQASKDPGVLQDKAKVEKLKKFQDKFNVTLQTSKISSGDHVKLKPAPLKRLKIEKIDFDKAAHELNERLQQESKQAKQKQQRNALINLCEQARDAFPEHEDFFYDTMQISKQDREAGALEQVYDKKMEIAEKRFKFLQSLTPEELQLANQLIQLCGRNKEKYPEDAQIYEELEQFSKKIIASGKSLTEAYSEKIKLLEEREEIEIECRQKLGGVYFELTHKEIAIKKSDELFELVKNFQMSFIEYVHEEREKLMEELTPRPKETTQDQISRFHKVSKEIQTLHVLIDQLKKVDIDAVRDFITDFESANLTGDEKETFFQARENEFGKKPLKDIIKARPEPKIIETAGIEPKDNEAVDRQKMRDELNKINDELFELGSSQFDPAADDFLKSFINCLEFYQAKLGSILNSSEREIDFDQNKLIQVKQGIDKLREFPANFQTTVELATKVAKSVDPSEVEREKLLTLSRAEIQSGNLDALAEKLQKLKDKVG